MLLTIGIAANENLLITDGMPAVPFDLISKRFRRARDSVIMETRRTREHGNLPWCSRRGLEAFREHARGTRKPLGLGSGALRVYPRAANRVRSNSFCLRRLSRTPRERRCRWLRGRKLLDWRGITL